jgi:hypothetical protein
MKAKTGLCKPTNDFTFKPRPDRSLKKLKDVID